MHQLIYVSEASPHLRPDEIFLIVEQSSRNNLRSEITGFLIFAGGRFLQLIEGPPHALDALITALRVDPRHHSVRVLSRRPITERSFPRWRMKRVGLRHNPLDELRNVLAAESRGAELPAEVVAFVADQLAPSGA